MLSWLFYKRKATPSFNGRAQSGPDFAGSKANPKFGSIGKSIATSNPSCPSKPGADSSLFDEELIAEVGAMRGSLPFLGSQLREVAVDIEDSVVRVCTEFQGISSQSREIVDLAENAVGSAVGAASETDITTAASEVLYRLLANVQNSYESTTAQSKRIDAIQEQLRLIEASLKDVDDMSDRAKIVALNGQIEASRMGSHGATFCVVAEETKMLAAKAGKTAFCIKQLVAQLTEALHTTSKELTAQSQRDQQIVHESQLTVDEMLNRLRGLQESMSYSMNRAGSISRALQTNICSAVGTLQFQDRINQRLDHVSEALNRMTSSLEPLASKVELSKVASRFEQWKKWFFEKSTMSDERKSILDSDSNGSSGLNQSAGSVELF